MPEPYTLVEMDLYSMQTGPQMLAARPTLLHAAVDGEDGEVTAACSYRIVPERDVPKRDLPFSANWAPRVQGAPKCPGCVAAIGATA